MKVFISWSKGKGEKLAASTRNFLLDLFGDQKLYFFSGEMQPGAIPDAEIHKNLLDSKKCILCLTKETYKSPWILYEAGIVYGRNYNENNNGNEIVLPIMFEDIPEWTSWTDKPINRYVPMRFAKGAKESFEKFVNTIAKEAERTIYNFDEKWEKYESQINNILENEREIPQECESLVFKLCNKEDFCLQSPNIVKGKMISFHRGFENHPLYDIVTKSIEQGGKYLWIYGRKNKKLMSNSYDGFFDYLADCTDTNGNNTKGIDFRCLFSMPESDAAENAQVNEYFDMDLFRSITYALNLKTKGLHPEKLFRLYTSKRKEIIWRSEDSILYSPIHYENNRLSHLTNKGFDVLSAKSDEGIEHAGVFEKVWENAVPLTENLVRKFVARFQ